MAEPLSLVGRISSLKKQDSSSRDVMKASAFDILRDDSDSAEDVPACRAPKTPSTATPSSLSYCGDSGDESSAEAAEPDPEWTVAPSRRKPRAAKPVAKPTEPRDKPQQVDQCDTIEADIEWFFRKGQRHAHSKAQKQEWNHKAKKRTVYAQQKRNDQRSGFAGLGEADD